MTRQAFDPSHLEQFTGTSQYYRVLPSFVVTDGLKFLMENVGCFWLANLYGLHLVDIDHNVHSFTVLKLRRVREGAVIFIEDGNQQTLSFQGLDFTDFPMETMTLFATWTGDYWVGMLPSEY